MSIFRSIGREIKAFITSPIIWGNLLAVIAVTVGFFILAFYFTKWYTNHGDSMEVADFTGLMVDEVHAQTRRSNQINVVVFDSIYHADKPGFMVLDQNPKPGSRVKKGRNIYLTVNKNEPPEVEIPFIWGMSFSAAERRLKAAGISTGTIEYRPFDRARNTILEVRYDGKIVQSADIRNTGVTVPLGRASIDLVVAEGSSMTEPVPNLVCRTLQEARAFLYGSTNLNLGEVIFDSTVTDSLNAYVYRQTPEHTGSNEIPLGSIIDIWITQFANNCDSLRLFMDESPSNTLQGDEDVDLW